MQRQFHPDQNFKKGEIVESNTAWLPKPSDYKRDQKASPGKYKEALESEEVREFIITCKQHINAGLEKSSRIILQELFQVSAYNSLDNFLFF